MAAKTTIEWTETTWNPVTGCSKISDGCQNCYAERMAKRLHAMGMKRYQDGFKVTLHDDLVELPFHWKKPRLVFVNSMSDLFHEDVPVSFINDVFETMEATPQHIYQVLTKRSTRLASIAGELNWPKNVWMGVTVESAKYVSRISDLQKVPASVRFLSIEPMIGPISDLPLRDIQWVIVGGESGPHSRPLKAKWVREIRDQCLEEGVPFFFKQWGGTNKKAAGRELDNRIWGQMPKTSHPVALAMS